MQTQVPLPLAAADCYGNAGNRGAVGLRASPAEVSREPGASSPARGSGLGPIVHVDGQAVPRLAWDASSSVVYFFF